MPSGHDRCTRLDSFSTPAAPRWIAKGGATLSHPPLSPPSLPPVARDSPSMPRQPCRLLLLLHKLQHISAPRSARCARAGPSPSDGGRFSVERRGPRGSLTLPGAGVDQGQAAVVREDRRGREQRTGPGSGQQSRTGFGVHDSLETDGEGAPSEGARRRWSYVCRHARSSGG